MFDSNRSSSNVFQVKNGSVTEVSEGDSHTNMDHYEDANIIIQNTTNDTATRYLPVSRQNSKELPPNLT